MSVIGTPAFPMSLSRSPSPLEDGGWSSPGLTAPFADGSGRHSPADGLRPTNANGNNVTWAGAKKKSEIVNGGKVSFSQSPGFLNRHMRSLSNSLPRFNLGGDYSYAEKEKLGRGRWTAKDGSMTGRVKSSVLKFIRKSRLRFIIIMGVLLTIILFSFTRKFRRLYWHCTAKHHSYTILVAQSAFLGRRPKVCGYSGSESGRWSNGMERTTRMGYRTRQCQK